MFISLKYWYHSAKFVSKVMHNSLHIVQNDVGIVKDLRPSSSIEVQWDNVHVYSIIVNSSGQMEHDLAHHKVQSTNTIALLQINQSSQQRLLKSGVPHYCQLSLYVPHKHHDSVQCVVDLSQSARNRAGIQCCLWGKRSTIYDMMSKRD